MKKIIILLLLFLTACSSNQIRKNDNESHSNETKKLESFYKDWYGVPYKYGGTDRNGIDCSAFIKNLFLEVYSIELPRNTALQMKKGNRIDYFERAKGDLIFFKIGSNTYHVGVYYENDNFIHASTSKGVMMSNLNESYWINSFLEVRRVM